VTWRCFAFWLGFAAASVLQSIPVPTFIFIIQNHLVRGLMFGAVKDRGGDAGNPQIH
jgi:ABC-type maltose transport system permease subunit